MRTTITIIALVLGLGAVAQAGPHEKFIAKITEDDARKTALAKVPGTITDHELEKEHGRWIYSFDIRSDELTKKGKHKMREVNVDATDGTIVAVE